MGKLTETHSPVLWFADKMLQNLARAAQRGKHGWEQMSFDECMAGVRREMRELREAVKSGDETAIVEECADVANFLMFLANNAASEED